MKDLKKIKLERVNKRRFDDELSVAKNGAYIFNMKLFELERMLEQLSVNFDFSQTGYEKIREKYYNLNAIKRGFSDKLRALRIEDGDINVIEIKKRHNA